MVARVKDGDFLRPDEMDAVDRSQFALKLSGPNCGPSRGATTLWEAAEQPKHGRGLPRDGRRAHSAELPRKPALDEFLKHAAVQSSQQLSVSSSRAHMPASARREGPSSVASRPGDASPKTRAVHLSSGA